MDRANRAARIIEAEFSFSAGQAALVKECFAAPIDFTGAGREHHLQLSLLPVLPGAEGCFPEYWGRYRFERIGDLFLAPANWRLHARSDCRLQHSVVCRFEPAQMAAWLEHDFAWTEPRATASLNIHNAEIRRLMCRIAEELRHPGFAAEAMIESMALQIGIELSRYFRGIEEDVQLGGLPGRRLRMIDAYLSEHPAGASLSGLAKLCGLSVRQLTRAFRASRGISLGNYIAQCRVDKARRLLGQGVPVKEVAYAAGFSAPSNFAAAFRRATGLSPRMYRALGPGKTETRKIH